MTGRSLDEVCQMLVRHSVDRFVSIDPNPFDGVALCHAPDHHVAVFDVVLTDLVSMSDVDGILCTVWIEVCPVGGLNGEGGLIHLVLFVALIIEARRRAVAIASDSSRTGCMLAVVGR